MFLAIKMTTLWACPEDWWRSDRKTWSVMEHPQTIGSRGLGPLALVKGMWRISRTHRACDHHLKRVQKGGPGWIPPKIGPQDLDIEVSSWSQSLDLKIRTWSWWSETMISRSGIPNRPPQIMVFGGSGQVLPRSCQDPQPWVKDWRIKAP